MENNRGKAICKMLKELRKRIADANGIAYEIEECTAEGPCPGTCPKCESEMRYITDAIREKERRGEPVAVDGLMAEEELRSFVRDTEDIIPSLIIETEGLFPISMEDHRRNKLIEDIFLATKQCIDSVEKHPDVGLYISETDNDVLCIPRSELEGEALFDYLGYDWRALLENGQPSFKAIGELASRLLHDNNDGNDDDGCEPLQGEVPLLPGVVAERPRRDNRHLAFSLLALLADESAERNLVFSPFGVAAILNMIQCGIAPHGLLSRHIDELLEGFWAPSADLTCGNANRIAHAANLWCDSGRCHIKPYFKKILARKFGSDPQEVDFDDRKKVEREINIWASRTTSGLIKRLDLDVTPDTFLVLASALCLKARWEAPFSPDDTRQRTFYNSDGTKTRVEMMHLMSGELYYESTADYQAVELEYRGGDISMVIVLPRKGKSLNGIMLGTDWLTVDPEDDLDVDLSLPKFKFETALELTHALTALGLGDLFDRDDALAGITLEPAHIGSVKQQCTLSVDEDGTEAAAVTYADAEVGCLPPDERPRYHRMIVDRPFGFAIKHCGGPILFMGVVNHLDGTAPDKTAPDPDAPAPAKIKQRLTTVTIAGTSHVKDIDDLASDIEEGTQLLLRHERDNKYDRHAVGVYLGDRRVGYVPREKNEILANLLDAGIPVRAVVTEAAWRGNWFSIKADLALTDPT